MKHIIECIAKNDLHEALVRCWRLLESDFPRFQEQEFAVLNQNRGSPCQEQKERIHKALVADEPLRIRNLPQEYPLAFLEVLDDYLFKRFDCSAGLSLSTHVLLDGETYVIHRRILQRSLDTVHASKTGHLQSWLHHHWIVPVRISGIEIRFRSAPDCIHKATQLRLKHGELKVYVGFFPDSVEPRWLNDDPTKWLARELTDPRRRWSSVLHGLREALAAEAAIVVLPELTVCPDLRRMVSDWLDDRPGHPFMLILPGSFHEEKDGKVFNIAELFNRFGNPVLHHRKLTRFGNQQKQEGIETGSRIELLDTPIGLIGMPICLDFCEEGEPFSSLWGRIGAEWLLVPAFGAAGSIAAHLRRAKELFRKHGTVSVIANQHPRGSDEDHGFVCHTAAKQPPLATMDHRSFIVNLTLSDRNK
jgi:predicted amidohydrolase